MAQPSIHIVIPHMGPAIGLYATIASLEHGLEGISHRYTVVSPFVLEGPEHKRLHARNITAMKTENLLGPAGAREAGAKGTDEEWLLFTDDHVIYPTQFCKRLFALDKDVMHVVTQCMFEGVRYYGYDSDKRADDIDCDINKVPRRTSPYPILSAGHGTMMVRRSVWDDMEGYSRLFEGYSGEEVYFGLKAWMMGYEVWMHPGIKVWHYPNPNAEYKNRDEEFQRRHRLAQAHIQSLSGTAKYSEAKARERVEALCT